MPRLYLSARPTSGLQTVQATALFVSLWVGAAFGVGEWFRGLGVAGLMFGLHRAVIVRLWLCRHQRTGMRLCRAGRLSEALHAFRTSAALWDKRRWLDRHRGWLLGSTVAHRYRDLGRYNQAYCYARLGRDDEAADLLRALLHDAPKMKMASALLAELTPSESQHPTWDSVISDPALRVQSKTGRASET